LRKDRPLDAQPLSSLSNEVAGVVYPRWRGRRCRYLRRF